MTKYPGSFILNEIGTRKELAAVYGVSERTIYRWMNKARAETGEKKPKPRRPRQSTLENFQGTRKELAKKYGVSERTVYRWLEKAKKQGADIPSRQKKKIAKDMSLPEEIITPDMLPQEIYTPEQLPEEIITPDMLPEEIITPDMLPEEISDTQLESITKASDLLLENADMLLEDDSLFLSMDPTERYKAVEAYLDYQYSQDPEQFMKPGDSPEPADPEYMVRNVNIWGSEFEEWLRIQDDIK